MCDKIKSHCILGFFIFLGLYFLGENIGSNYFKSSELERSISVSGFSEKSVKADSVFWPISFVVKGNDLKETAKKMQKDANTIKSYLLSKGMSENEISFMQAQVQYQNENQLMRKGMLEMNADSFSITASEPMFSQASVEDAMPELGTQKEVQNSESNEKANEEESKKESNKDIYIVSNTILVRSDKVDLIIELSHSINELLLKNINISTQYNYSQIEYKFNKLEEVKQEMLKEANQKAFELASNFAKDSRSSLGKVKKARQGDFSINTPNRYEEYIKKIRVENQVEYYLVN